MNKESFLLALSAALGGLPERERISTLEYYAEVIGDRVDAGQTEEQAVAELGTPDDIAARLYAEGGYTPAPLAPQSAPDGSSEQAGTPYSPGETPSAAPQYASPHPAQQNACSRKTVFWIVFACTFPIWIGFVAGAIGILVGFAATAVGLVGGAVGCVVLAAVTFVQSVGGGLACIGAGLFCLGAGILLAVGTVGLCRLAVRGLIALFRWGLTGSAHHPTSNENEGSVPVNG